MPYDEVEHQRIEDNHTELLKAIDKELEEIAEKYDLPKEIETTDTKLQDEFTEILKIKDISQRKKQLSKIFKIISDELKFSRHFE